MTGWVSHAFFFPSLFFLLPSRRRRRSPSIKRNRGSRHRTTRGWPMRRRQWQYGAMTTQWQAHEWPQQRQRGPTGLGRRQAQAAARGKKKDEIWGEEGMWDPPLTCGPHYHVIENHIQNRWVTKNKRISTRFRRWFPFRKTNSCSTAPTNAVKNEAHKLPTRDVTNWAQKA